MIPARAFAGRRVAVFGLGRTGLAAARALLAGGAEVSAWDENAEVRARAEAEGVPLDDLNRRDWGDVAALVLSPGVPLTHPEPHRMVRLAQAVGAPVIGDMELFARALAGVEGAATAGITGTNGKSTTTALLGHILAEAGRDVRVGGNIGEAVMTLPPPRPGAVFVLELSSYQLDLVESLRLDAAVFLNLTPDHLDRHGDMEGYFAAKKRIFANQRPEDAAIVGVDDAWTRRLVTELTARRDRTVIPISASRVAPGGVYALGGALYDALDGRARPVLGLAEAEALPGRHNAQNIAAAYAAARRLGVSAEDAARAVASFPGLAHRQELVGKIGAVRIVNDSKATNADAAAQALGCYDDVFWIAGGQAKAGGVESLSGLFPRIRKAYLIGQDAGLIARQLDGHVASERCGELEAALKAAVRDARESGAEAPVVLLSPACASFDQFKSFEHRGDVFRDLARALVDASETGDAA